MEVCALVLTASYAASQCKHTADMVSKRSMESAGGYEGPIKDYGHSVWELTPDAVRNIHTLGGSIRGTSRGPQDAVKIVERLCELNINVLFIIGGDGTLRGADRIASESQRRNHAIAIVGILKPSTTIYCSRTKASATKPRVLLLLRRPELHIPKHALFETVSVWSN